MYTNDLVNKLEVQSRQPSLYFSVLIADHNKAYEIMKLLLDAGANPNFKDQYIQTVLFYACREGSTGLTQVRSAVSICCWVWAWLSMNKTSTDRHPSTTSHVKIGSPSCTRSSIKVLSHAN